LAADLTFIRSKWSASSVLALQMGLAAGALLGWAAGSAAFGLGLLMALAVRSVISGMRRRRVAQLEPQIEGWLGALARSLDAAPSLGEAIFASAMACRAPLREELEWVQNEMRLGLSLERALYAWEGRVQSEVLSLALLTLHIGRMTGGALPQVLKEAASTLREMERLRGVIRVKTAEGRAQSYLIGGLPLPLCLGMNWMDESHFDPLKHSPIGHVLVGIAALLWAAAIFSAKKIMAVRI
jgi:tight adherence protein B